MKHNNSAIGMEDAGTLYNDHSSEEEDYIDGANTFIPETFWKALVPEQVSAPSNYHKW